MQLSARSRPFEPTTGPGLADAALRKAVGVWFFVTVLGLWVFLSRVVAQYGAGTVSGHFEDWERNTETSLDQPEVPPGLPSS